MIFTINFKEDLAMKALGILLIGAMAVAGGIAAATYITKKKLDKENEDNYYDDWDNDNIDDDWDFDFDEDMDVEGEPAPDAEVPEKPFSADELYTSGSSDDDLKF